MSLTPPFTAETAQMKVKIAQDLWNTQYALPSINPVLASTVRVLDLRSVISRWYSRTSRDPERVAKAYTTTSIWRNRNKFLTGTDEIVAFLRAKWEKEKEYRFGILLSHEILHLVILTDMPRLRKELFNWSANRIAVQFWYEYRDAHDGMKWKRCYGLEDWTYDEADGGKMR
jgi:uncharacterized protein